MPAEMLAESKEAPPDRSATTASRDEELQTWARKHVERIHKLKRDIAIFLLGIATLTGIWAIIEWQDNGGFQRLSDNGNPGDWDPWIFYVALVWGFFVLLDALKVYFDRPTTEEEIDRQVERIRFGR